MMFERRLLSCAGTVLIVLVSCATGHASPWPVTCQTIFYEDWRSEFFDGYYWTAGGTGGASPRIQEYFGSAAVFLDRPSGLQARVELTLTVDLAGYDNVEIAFDAFARGPRIAPPSEPFSGGCDADGMAVSLDGVTWYPIRDFDDLPHDMAPFVLDLDAAMGYWGLAYTDSIRIRFFVYTGEDWMVKGVVMDNIHITGFPKDIYNFGHAPDPPYPTLLISNGARHKVEGDIRLGATVGTDFDGRFCPSQTPTFRDGVALPDVLVAGSSASIEVTVPTACMLDAWFDFNGDGVWSEAGEKVFDSLALSPGTSVLSVNVPADAALSDQGYARFRVSSAGGLSPTGEADDGEVEDYPFTLQCGAPEVEPLPEYSAGDTLTVAWQPLFPGAHYEAQRSLSPDFDIIEATSGWITELSHVFAGLTLNQTHYYRVRAGAAMPGDRTVWRQTRARDFLLGEGDGVGICAEEGVRLAQTAPLREFAVKIDGLDDLRVPFSNGGRMNMFLMTQDVLLTEFAMYLTVPAASEIAFVVYKGGALLSSPVTRILNVVRQVQPGQGFYGSGDISVALESGVHYYLGVAGPDAYEIHAQSPGVNMDCADFTARGRFFVYPAPDTEVEQYSDAMMFFTRFTYFAEISHAASGALVSPVIDLDTGETWDDLVYVADAPANTTLTLDILPESGDTPIAGYADMSSGADLSGLPALPIRLRATLETSGGAVTPTLFDWSVTRRAGDDYMLEGSWSEPVHSTQALSTLCVAGVTLLDPATPPTATARFEVTFTEPVYGMDTTPPFEDFRVSGMSDAVIAEVDCNDGDMVCVVTIEAGAVDGDARLDVVTGGPLRNASNDPLCDDFVTGPSYLFDLNPPGVHEIQLLDDPITNAPQVSFQVVFNKAVYNMEMTAPFSDFALSGDATGEIINVSGADAAYTVTVAVGESEGALRLDILDSGPLEDHLGRGLAASYTDGPAYQISRLKFTLLPPETVEVMIGGTLTLEVLAEGGVPPVEYQWHRSQDGVAFSPIPDATSPSLSLDGIGWTDAGYYYCEAYNAYETILSPATEVLVEDNALGGNMPAAAISLATVLIALFFRVANRRHARQQDRQTLR